MFPWTSRTTNPALLFYGGLAALALNLYASDGRLPSTSGTDELVLGAWSLWYSYFFMQSLFSKYVKGGFRRELFYLIYRPRWLWHQPGRDMILEGLRDGDILREQLEAYRLGIRRTISQKSPQELLDYVMSGPLEILLWVDSAGLPTETAERISRHNHVAQQSRWTMTLNDSNMHGRLATLYYRQVPVLAMGYRDDPDESWTEAFLFDPYTRHNGKLARISAPPTIRGAALAVLGPWEHVQPQWRKQLGPYLGAAQRITIAPSTWALQARVAASGLAVSGREPVLFAHARPTATEVGGLYFIEKAGGVVRTLAGREAFPLEPGALLGESALSPALVGGAREAVDEFLSVVRPHVPVSQFIRLNMDILRADTPWSMLLALLSQAMGAHMLQFELPEKPCEDYFTRDIALAPDIDGNLHWYTLQEIMTEARATTTEELKQQIHTRHILSVLLGPYSRLVHNWAHRVQGRWRALQFRWTQVQFGREARRYRISAAMMRAESLHEKWLAFLRPQWFEVPLPVYVDPELDVRRLMVFSDVHGIVRSDHDSPIDPKIVAEIERAGQTGRADFFFISGSSTQDADPAYRARTENDAWRSQPVGWVDAFLRAFGPSLRPYLHLYGAMGGDQFDPLTGKTKYLHGFLPQAAFEGLRLLLQVFLEQQKHPWGFAGAPEAKMARLALARIPWLLSYEDERRLRAGDFRTPEQFRNVMELIRHGIDPNAKLIFRGPDMEFQVERPSLDLRPLRARLRGALAENPHLMLNQMRPPAPLIFGYRHHLKVSRTSKEWAMNGILVNALPLAIPSDESRQELVVGVGDGFADRGVYLRADVGLHLGLEKKLPLTGRDNIVMVYDRHGRDDVSMNASPAVFRRLTEAIGKPFREWRYFQVPNRHGHWRWSSLQELSRAAGGKSLAELTRDQARFRHRVLAWIGMGFLMTVSDFLGASFLIQAASRLLAGGLGGYLMYGAVIRRYESAA